MNATRSRSSSLETGGTCDVCPCIQTKASSLLSLPSSARPLLCSAYQILDNTTLSPILSIILLSYELLSLTLLFLLPVYCHFLTITFSVFYFLYFLLALLPKTPTIFFTLSWFLTFSLFVNHIDSRLLLTLSMKYK